jgi:hypothetical protein
LFYLEQEQLLRRGINTQKRKRKQRSKMTIENQNMKAKTGIKKREDEILGKEA